MTSWPPPGTTGQSWYLQPDGTLGPAAASGTGESASRFDFDPELATATTFEGDDANDLFKALPDYDWQQEPSGSAAVFVSPPLTTDAVMVGSASADLWIRTNADDADLGITLSEVRPDGKETYVQSGILRASNRKVAAGSTDLLPLHTELEADAEPVPDGEFVEARVEILPFGHIVRAGSRLANLGPHAGRRQASVELHPQGLPGRHLRRCRPLRRAPVEGGVADHAGHHRLPVGPASLSGPPRATVPRLRGVHQHPRRLTLALDSHWSGVRCRRAGSSR